MKIKISSTDRLGISQEILSIVAKRQWNLVAMEVVPNASYLNIDPGHITFATVLDEINSVDGVLAVELIDLLPTESREQHLNTMLSRIPDLIFDIDTQGIILSSNLHIVESNSRLNDHEKKSERKIIGNHVLSLMQLDLTQILSTRANSVDVTFDGKPYIAESTPVIVSGKLNGAVLMLKAIESIGKQISLLQQGKTHQIDNILGHSRQIKLLKEQLVKFAQLDLPILLTGETGTGKELFARAIHDASERKNGPFLAINCASLSEHLLESELFGYVAGAFTGAQRSGKPGLFELANGGTVFLDEIAEMSGYLQAKLLRFLQDYSYRRLGGTKELTANVRIISASHQQFEQMIVNKTFREDLYYRLNVLNLGLPALRDRKEDIELLSQHFLRNAARQVNQTMPDISADAMDLLLKYPWPGNIRQLQNVLFRLVALSDHDLITEEDVEKVLSNTNYSSLPDEALQEKTLAGYSSRRNNWLVCETWKEAQQLFEKELLSEFYPLFPSTRKLAKRLAVSHNKIAIKMRENNILDGDVE